VVDRLSTVIERRGRWARRLEVKLWGLERSGVRAWWTLLLSAWGAAREVEAGSRLEAVVVGRVSLMRERAAVRRETRTMGHWRSLIVEAAAPRLVAAVEDRSNRLRIATARSYELVEEVAAVVLKG